MADFTTTWSGGLRFLHTGATGHACVTDAPSQTGGPCAAPTPMEFVLHALAGCAGVDVVSILTKMQQPLAGLEIGVTAERAESHPRIYTKIHLEFRVKGAVEERKLQHALELSHDEYCSVAAMLRGAAELTYSYILQG
jgi:putative redox protein